ncbi:winged helix-turn-helix domain-containing protein [Bradyrhizobium sp. STM 3843]|uniref:winged helix-turn-helix domain-containing protein n=1 Tax=Bradyrhizobium sp. STM 3843 TaxID=551947 RepID=UPI001111A516|nr:winged helix-turn-helix domain-containing protein [Bradyrhizobium sp. STM 3843]
MMYHDRRCLQNLPKHTGNSSNSEAGADLLDDVVVLTDDGDFRDRVVSFLDGRVRSLSPAQWSDDLVSLLKREPLGLVLIDLWPVAADRLDQLRWIRSQVAVPIIATGSRLEAADRILALELGADACIAKTSELQEFWATARALRRRECLARQTYAPAAERGIDRFNGWTLNRASRALIDPEGKTVTLNRTHHALLAAFLDAPGRTLTRLQLSQATRLRTDISDRTIDVQVLRLRRILERTSAEGPIIETERGVGYRFVASVQRDDGLLRKPR